MVPSEHPRQPALAHASRTDLPSDRPRLTLWPLDENRYGLDATFQGHWACEDAERHAAKLRTNGMANVIRPESDGAWTVRLGPLHTLDVARAISSLIR